MTASSNTVVNRTNAPSVPTVSITDKTGRSRVYFPNLNGIRFIAAFMVLVSHVEYVKQISGSPNYHAIPFIHEAGELGVTLFFVLSGFLITYLLLSEKKSSGTIRVRNFYVRRILRIWPVYYVATLLAFFVFPHFITLPGWSIHPNEPHFWTKFLLFIFFLPNLSLVMYPLVPFASQLWSVGVEEQFYLIWPWIHKHFTKTPYVLLAVAAVGTGARLLGEAMLKRHPSEFWRIFDVFAYCTRIQCMAIGGMGAFVLMTQRERVLKFVYSRAVQIVVLSAAIASQAMHPNLGVFQSEFYALLYALIIVNAAGNPKFVLSLENRLFNYLGNISYGIYVYQTIAIMVSYKIVGLVGSFDRRRYSIGLMYLLSTCITLAISTVSYYGFEKRLLKLKDRFSSVLSNRQG